MYYRWNGCHDDQNVAVREKCDQDDSAAGKSGGPSMQDCNTQLIRN